MTKEKFTHLVSKEIGGNISDKEKHELEQTLSESPRMKAVYNELNQFVKETKENEDVDIEAKLNDVWDRITNQETGEASFYLKEKTGARKAIYLWSRIAAAVILVAGLSWLAYRAFSPKEVLLSEKISAGNEALFTVLDDGSQVWLSPHSEIAFNKQFGKEARKVELIGKAYFDVVHNASVPFTVDARKVDVTVKGTAFNVDASSVNVEVALFRGLIAVKDNRDNGDEEITLHPNQKVMLREGEKATNDSIHAIKEAVVTKDSVVVHKEAQWTQGALVFQKQRLDNLCKLMEKRYGVEITIENSKVASQHFTGVITDETIKQMLDALRQSYPFTYEIKGRKVTIK